MIICPIWACPWAKNLSNLTPLESRLCGTHISEFKSAGTDLLHSKFYGIVWTCSCATSHQGHLPIFPIWSCPWAKRLSNQVPLGSLLCGTHISKTDGWIYIVQSSMLLYKPVVVQYMYNHDVYNARMAETYLATANYVWPAAVDTLPLVKT